MNRARGEGKKRGGKKGKNEVRKGRNGDDIQFLIMRVMNAMEENSERMDGLSLHRTLAPLSFSINLD